MNLASRLFLASFFAVAASACGPSGAYVWVTQLPPEQAASSEYLIAPGDVLNVRVYMQDAVSTKARVRSDGRISVPFVGDVLVQGKTPLAVGKEIETSLRSFINAPSVSVSVEEFQPITVSVVGEVAKPTTLTLDREAGLLQAIAGAGGLTDNANRDAIFVLRGSPTPERIRFTYDMLTENPGLRFYLRTGDVVVVE